MSEPKISVIIPLYNAEKYIRECLISVLASKFQDYEVLVVDDCSTDNSLSEVEKLLPHFNGRLKILSTEKNSGGPGLPRNIGIKNASGKYITFIDNDDMILPDALENFFTLGEAYEAEVIYTERCVLFRDKFQPKTSRIYNLVKKEKMVDKPTFAPDDLSLRINHLLNDGVHVIPWNSLYRRDFLIKNNIEFPPYMKYGEDFILLLKCMCLAKRYLCVPNVTHIHRIGIISASNWINSGFSEEVHSSLDLLFKKIFYIDEFMGKLKFFQDNPEVRHAIFKFTFTEQFNIMKGVFRKMKPYEAQKLLFDQLQNPAFDSTIKDLVAAYIYTELAWAR